MTGRLRTKLLSRFRTLALPALAALALPATAQNNTEQPGTPFVLPKATPPTNAVTADTIVVDRITVSGNSVFTADELLEPVRSFEGRRLAAEDIQNVRRLLTQHYIDHGYINSGALLENRVVTNRVLEFRIIEGTLRDVEVTTDGHLARGYVRARLPRAGSGPDAQPLNTQDIQHRLKLLKDDPRIDNLSATLGPGVQLGEAILNVQVAEAKPWRVQLSGDNHGSASLGSTRGTAAADCLNLTGWGDSVHGEYTTVGDSHDYACSYAVPLSGDDTVLSAEYRSASAAVTSEPFDKLDIESSMDSKFIALARPFHKSQATEFSLELKLETRHSQSSLLGEPYSFSEGVVDGESRDTALRFSQQWVSRSIESVLALHSTLNQGLDLFDATLNDGKTPDSRFFAWTGQSQWLRRLEHWDSQLVAKSNLQISANPLLQIEKVSVGGSGTVRGYRENQLTTDNAINASLEWRIPLYQGRSDLVTGSRSTTQFRLLPFIDWGLGWNVESDAPDPNSLWSAGLGADFSIGETLYAGIYWGHAFVELEEAATHDLQDDGVHFSAKVAY